MVISSGRNFNKFNSIFLAIGSIAFILVLNLPIYNLYLILFLKLDLNKQYWIVGSILLSNAIDRNLFAKS
jgi:hypothetical protein